MTAYVGNRLNQRITNDQPQSLRVRPDLADLVEQHYARLERRGDAVVSFTLPASRVAMNPSLSQAREGC